MPIYEFECPVHDQFELYFHKPNTEDQINCPICEMFNLAPQIAERVWSVCTMRPDKYWNGGVVNGKYVTNNAEAAAVMEGVEVADWRNIRLMQQSAQRAKQERADKANQELQTFLTEELRTVDDTTFAPEPHETEETFTEAIRQRNEWLVSKQGYGYEG